MSRLLFDIGNTRIKWVIEDKACFVASGSIDPLALVFFELEASLSQCPAITAVLASNVGSLSVEKVLTDWAEQLLGLAIVWARVTGQFGEIKNTYTELDKLGVDRWMAVIAADEYRKEGGCAVIVVDAGTAVTIELLHSNARYEGGAILPGLKLMHDSLVGNTQGIASELVQDIELVGQSTQACVNAGVHYGLVGAIQGLVERMILSLGSNTDAVTLIVTGGDAEFVQANSNLNFIVDPHLVLKGLVLMAVKGGFE